MVVVWECRFKDPSKEAKACKQCRRVGHPSKQKGSVLASIRIEWGKLRKKVLVLEGTSGTDSKVEYGVLVLESSEKS